MKPVKKLTAILLCIAITTVLFILPASAEEAQAELLKPAVTVTAAEGEIVSELALDFTPEETSVPIRFDSADLDKSIVLTIQSNFGNSEFNPLTLRPKAFNAETGVLTVSLLNYDGQVGFALHDDVCTINGEQKTMFSFLLLFPEGLLKSSRDETEHSAESICECGNLCDVAGMPIRTIGNFTFPSWPAKLYDRFISKIHSGIIQNAVMISIAFPMILFRFSDFARMEIALYESFTLYKNLDPTYFLPYILAVKLFN